MMDDDEGWSILVLALLSVGGLLWLMCAGRLIDAVRRPWLYDRPEIVLLVGGLVVVSTIAWALAGM